MDYGKAIIPGICKNVPFLLLSLLLSLSLHRGRIAAGNYHHGYGDGQARSVKPTHNPLCLKSKPSENPLPSFASKAYLLPHHHGRSHCMVFSFLLSFSFDSPSVMRVFLGFFLSFPHLSSWYRIIPTEMTHLHCSVLFCLDCAGNPWPARARESILPSWGQGKWRRRRRGGGEWVRRRRRSRRSKKKRKKQQW